jgi:hypothetical protein
VTGHTAHTGHTRALDTERESQVIHGDLDHGVRVHILVEHSNVYSEIICQSESHLVEHQVSVYMGQIAILTVHQVSSKGALLINIKSPMYRV